MCQALLALKTVHQTTFHKQIGFDSFHLSEKGELKLTNFADFNSACPAEQVVYLAPELAATGEEVISEDLFTSKTDIWSLGALMYDLCCLKNREITNFHSKGTLPVIPDDYSDSLFDLISIMLSHDPTHRPEAQDLLQSVSQSPLTQEKQLMLPPSTSTAYHHFYSTLSRLGPQTCKS